MIISVANLKGGVGKTTTVMSLGFALAGRGYKVLLLDTDPGGSLTVQLSLEESLPLSRFLKKEADNPDLIKSYKEQKKLYAIVSDKKLSSVDSRLMYQGRIKPFPLKKRLAAIKDKFDFILIDTPPSFSGLTLNAVFAADLTIIPVQPEFTVFHGLSRMIDAIKLLDRIKREKSQYRILLTIYDKKSDKRKKYLNLIENRFNEFIFKTVIENDPEIKIASNIGEPINSYNPESTGSLQYNELADEILLKYN